MDFTLELSEYPPMTIRSFPYSIIEWCWSGTGSSGPIERFQKMQDLVKEIKQNHFKKQFSSSSFFLAWSTQQASSMILRHRSSLLSTLLPVWTFIIILGK